ncbi:MAG: glycosyltransferase [bacterium]
MAKKSILFIITKSVLGGANKYVYDLSIGLSNEFEIYIAGGGKGKFAQEIIKSNIPYFSVKNFQKNVNIFKDFLAIFEIYNLLCRLKPDIIHINSSKAGGIAGFAGFTYKLFTKQKPLLIFTAHGWAFAEHRPKSQIFLIKLFSKLTCLFYDKIICVSEYDYKIALENKIAPSNKLITIHNGIDSKSINFLSKEQAQKKLLGKTSSLIIGTIAELTKNKGILYLLQAIVYIKENKNAPDFDTILIAGGENPDKDKVQSFIKQHHLKNIYLFESINNASSYLKAFDIFVLPSIKEGLPYTILEAMTAQLPIISANVGGIPEILISKNINNQDAPSPEDQDAKGRALTYSGIMIEPKNSQQLAEKILYLIKNPEIAKNLAENGHKIVEQEFSFTKMIKQTKKIYNYALLSFPRKRESRNY